MARSENFVNKLNLSQLFLIINSYYYNEFSQMEIDSTAPELKKEANL